MGFPESLRRRAEGLAAGEDIGPIPPAVPAATVVLIRSRQPDGGLEVFLQRRVATMAFAAGMHVFPGGRVDAQDADVPLARAVSTWSEPLVGAAVRETFEECGLLLAVDSTGLAAQADRDSHLQLQVDRADVLAERVSFGELLRRRGLRIDPALLVPFARWVTPEVELRRYDTHFFIASADDVSHAVSDEVTGEADAGFWITPAEALRRQARGECPMLPPTIAAIADLADCADSGSAMTRSRSLVPLMPRAFLEEGSLVWALVDAETGERLSPVAMPGASEVAGATREGRRT